MRKRNFLLTVLFSVSLLAAVACGGGTTVQPPTPTPADALTPSATRTPPPTSVPADTQEAAQAADAASILALGTENLTELVTSSPALMSCIAERLGFSSLMELAQREPSQDEVDQMVPCFLEGGVTGAMSVPEPPAKESAPVLTAPEGIPWYKGPLFDSHMHMIGLSNSFYGDRFTTDDVRRMMDRNDIRAGVGFYMPPVTGRESEVDQLLGYVDDLSDRMVALLMPTPFDFGLDTGFLGFANGTYSRTLLEPLFPPQGSMEGFGEIAFYTDHFGQLQPDGPEMNEVYPVIAETGGVVMIHPRTGQTAEQFAAVIGEYPEITFLFHGTNSRYDAVGEGTAILELLSGYDFENVYYTLDTASVLDSPEYPGTLQMDPESAEEFVAVMIELGVQELAEQAFEEYGQIIIDHPDRTMWATDVLNSWHFEDAGIDMLVDFSRRFIAMLPEQIQERFAFANAWDAFSGYLD